eukprot:5567886-Pyramimonas_sp.AAC.1
MSARAGRRPQQARHAARSRTCPACCGPARTCPSRIPCKAPPSCAAEPPLPGCGASCGGPAPT